MAPAVLLDCDPGHDDVVAIVVAAHHADLVGITTVAGNAPLERTTYNARVVRELIGLDVEIHSGASRPLVAEPRHAPFVHGESGLDGADLPVPQRPVDGHDAAGFIVETCRQRPGAWIVATGPLTNVALALRSDPDLFRHVDGISIMGGGTFGNRSPVAEFNIWADPEAADIVFSSGVRLVMAGLDVTHQLQATPPRIERVRAAGGQLAAVLADLLDFFTETYIARHEGMVGAAVHDPLAVLALTHPQLFEQADRHVQIETTGVLTRGMTVIDRRTLVDRPEPNCRVLGGVDDETAFDIIVDAVARSSPT